jgi:putative transcriptional regulator
MMETMHDAIAVGRLLVATPLLQDPNFRRSVVLLVEHDEGGGTVGVVLNRPTEVPVAQVLSAWAGLVTGPSVVFQGGPVALDNALALARVPSGTGGTGGTGAAGPTGWRSLGGPPAIARVGLVDLDAPPDLVATGVERFRVFAGYAGWSDGQLRSEIEEGAWYVVPAAPGDVFAEDPGQLWQAVLRRQGGDLAFVATFPDDPSLN